MTEYYVEASDPDEGCEMTFSSHHAYPSEWYTGLRPPKGKSLYKLVKVEIPVVFPKEPDLNKGVVVSFKDGYGNYYAAVKNEGSSAYRVTWDLDCQEFTWAEILEFAGDEEPDVQAVYDTFRYL